MKPFRPNLFLALLLTASLNSCHSTRKTERAAMSPSPDNPMPRAGDTIFIEKANGDVEMKVIQKVGK